MPAAAELAPTLPPAIFEAVSTINHEERLQQSRTDRPRTTRAIPSPPPVRPIPEPFATVRTTLSSGALATPSDGVLATAVYVAGSSNLESGRRYSIAVVGDRLRILGPMDTDPSTVALERPLRTISAHAVEGRFVASDRRGAVLAFMSVAGATPEQLAAMVMGAARDVIAP